jgi:hypothetical protein
LKTKPSKLKTGFVAAIGFSNSWSERLMQEALILKVELLKSLRQQRFLSQEDLFNACRQRSLRVSLATIKRAETGKKVSYRTVRELSTFYAVPALSLVMRESTDSGLV